MKRQTSLLGLLTLATINGSSLGTLAVEPPIQEIIVTVERATTTHEFDPNINPFSDDQKPDFFSTLTIDNRATRTSQKFDNRLDAPLNFTVTERFSNGNPHALYPITIRLFDHDNTSGNEEADIGHGTEKRLLLLYQPSAKTIYLKDQSSIGRTGDLIKFTGNDLGGFKGAPKNATVYFRVTHR